MKNHATKRRTWLADIGLLYAAAIWGSTFFLVKDSLTDIDPITLVGYRFLLPAVLLGIYLWWRGIPLFKNWQAGLGLGTVLCALYIPQTVGLGITSAANSALITGLFVVFVPFFALLFFRRRSRWGQWLAVVISLLGLWFLTGGLTAVNKGDLITIVSAMSYAAHILLADHLLQKDLDPLVLNFQQDLVVGIISLALAATLQRSFAVASMRSIWVVVFLAIFPTLSAFIIQMLAQRHTTAVKVSLIFALEPVFGAVFAWTLGGEEFIVQRAFGGLLIFAAIVISNLTQLSPDSPLT